MSGLIEDDKVGTTEDPLAVAISQLAEFKRPRKVLFVEDSQGMRLLFGRLAEEFNCEVTYAEDGPSGLAAVLAETFDLVILDIVLAPGMDGIDVFAALSEKLGVNRPPVAFFTGRLDDEQGKRIGTIGFACFIKKPFDFNERFMRSFFHTFGITEKTP